MLHFEVELEVAYELSSRLHYLITLFTLFTRFCFFFYLVCNFFGGGGAGSYTHTGLKQKKMAQHYCKCDDCIEFCRLVVKLYNARL